MEKNTCCSECKETKQTGCRYLKGLTPICECHQEPKPLITKDGFADGGSYEPNGVGRIEEKEQEEWGGWKFVSEMLDNPDEYGIYPTSKCYKQLYDFVVEQKAKGFQAGVSAERERWGERIKGKRKALKAEDCNCGPNPVCSACENMTSEEVGLIDGWNSALSDLLREEK